VPSKFRALWSRFYQLYEQSHPVVIQDIVKFDIDHFMCDQYTLLFKVVTEASAEGELDLTEVCYKFQISSQENVPLLDFSSGNQQGVIPAQRIFDRSFQPSFPSSPTVNLFPSFHSIFAISFIISQIHNDQPHIQYFDCPNISVADPVKELASFKNLHVILPIAGQTQNSSKRRFYCPHTRILSTDPVTRYSLLVTATARQGFKFLLTLEHKIVCKLLGKNEEHNAIELTQEDLNTIVTRQNSIDEPYLCYLVRRSETPDQLHHFAGAEV